MNPRTRTAFTLVELIVVFAVLAFLIGLLLPLVQMIRTSAARMESSNNLKQIGLALHSHHDARKMFPAGVDKNGFSAATHALPFVEQDNVFKLIDFTKPARAQDEKIRSLVIAVYNSPLDPLSARPGSTNYLYSAGTKHSLDENNGIFFRDSKGKLAQVSDGLSNTIMVGETLLGDGGNQAKSVKRQHVELDPMSLKNLNDNSGVQEFASNKNIAGDRGHSWLEGKFLQTLFSGTRKFNDERPDVNCGGAGGLSALRSLHKGNNVLFGDGSVRFLSDSLAFETWQALCTAAGGEVVNVP